MKYTLFAVFLITVMCFAFLPLGQVNASTNQIFWGAYVGPSHIGTLAELRAFESNIGKGVAIWSIFQFWDRPQDSENDPNFDTAWMNTCRAHGAIPEIAFDPGDGSVGGNDVYKTYFSLILSGYYDSYLTNWARNASAWGHPFFIRLFHEIDDSFDATYENQFITAYRYVHDLFVRNGATQISWIWSGAGYMYSNDASAQGLYPGDQYVDWSGIGNYVWSDATLDSMIGRQYRASLSVAPSKPIMIVEIGYIGIFKDVWWGDVLVNQLPNRYPQIKALVIWEMNEFNVDTSLFRTCIQSNYYTANIYSSLSVSPIDALITSTPLPISTNGLATREIVAAFIVIVIVAVAVVVLKATNVLRITRANHSS